MSSELFLLVHITSLFSHFLLLLSARCVMKVIWNPLKLLPLLSPSSKVVVVVRGGGGDTSRRRRVWKGGGPGEARGALAPFLILRCAFPGPRPSRDRPLSQLVAQPLGFYFMNCLFKEDLLGHPERTRGEGERELSPAAQSDRKPDRLLFQ